MRKYLAYLIGPALVLLLSLPALGQTASSGGSSGGSSSGGSSSSGSSSGSNSSSFSSSGGSSSGGGTSAHGGQSSASMSGNTDNSINQNADVSSGNASSGSQVKSIDDGRARSGQPGTVGGPQATVVPGSSGDDSRTVTGEGGFTSTQTARPSTVSGSGGGGSTSTTTGSAASARSAGGWAATGVVGLLLLAGLVFGIRKIPARA